MKRSIEMARARLESDIRKAVDVAAARYATGCEPAVTESRLNRVRGAAGYITDAVMQELTRNWSVVERPRGKRAAS